ncbi:MAG: TVP38/TMEM64 family protein [Pseudomonadota bacterium]
MTTLNTTPAEADTIASDMTETDTAETGRPAWMTWALVAAGLGALIAAWTLLPVSEWIAAFRDWVAAQGPLGWIIFIAVYAVSVLALLPGSLLTLAAGLAWGLWGFPIVIAGATLGAGISFIAARYFAQGTVQQMIAKRPTLAAVDKAVEQEGWKIVGLMRLSPAFPFALQNWFFGTTSVAFWPYLAATFVGIMPGTLLYVWIGSLGAEAGSDSATTAKYVVFGIGILATLAVTVYVTKLARKKLAEAGV